MVTILWFFHVIFTVRDNPDKEYLYKFDNLLTAITLDILIFLYILKRIDL